MKKFLLPVLIFVIFSPTVRAEGLMVYAPCAPDETGCQTFADKEDRTFSASPKGAVEFTVTDAHMNEGDSGFSLVLSDESAKAFATFTAANLDKQVGQVFDGTLLSAPIVKAVITGGEIYYDNPFENNFAANNRLRCKKIFPACADYKPPLFYERALQAILGFFGGYFGDGVDVKEIVEDHFEKQK